MSDKAVKIVKVGNTEPTPPPAQPKKGRKFTAHKTYPRSAMKISKAKVKAVKDPARPPPRKSTVRVITNKGLEQRRQNIRKTVKNMPPQKIRETLRKSGLPISDKTPKHIAEEILEGGMEAGFIKQ